MMHPAAVRAIVRGQVQGVYFRAFATSHATHLGLTGYVRNLPDGSVEVVAEGETTQLRQLVDHLHLGPPAARVAEVATEWSTYTGSHSGFRIRR